MLVEILDLIGPIAVRQVREWRVLSCVVIAVGYPLPLLLLIVVELRFECNSVHWLGLWGFARFHCETTIFFLIIPLFLQNFFVLSARTHLIVIPNTTLLILLF